MFSYIIYIFIYKKNYQTKLLSISNISYNVNFDAFPCYWWKIFYNTIYMLLWCCGFNHNLLQYASGCACGLAVVRDISPPLNLTSQRYRLYWVKQTINQNNLKFIFTIFMIVPVTAIAEYTDPHCQGKQVIVHLFEWKWTDIADECERFLSKKGYCGVQVSKMHFYIFTNWLSTILELRVSPVRGLKMGH